MMPVANPNFLRQQPLAGAATGLSNTAPSRSAGYSMTGPRHEDVVAQENARVRGGQGAIMLVRWRSD